MASLAQQLSKLAAQLAANLRDSIPVGDAVIGVVLEQHSPGNGSTYPRLRAPKGKTLANGKRTIEKGIAIHSRIRTPHKRRHLGLDTLLQQRLSE